MIEEYYEILSWPYKFHAIVLKDPENGLHRIKFGGKKGCVMFSIYDDEIDPNLDGISYGRECAYNRENPLEGLLPSAGTVDMANVAFAFVSSVFPDKGDVILKDQSKITCNKNRKVSLQHYYIAKHAKTWYQAKFGAKLANRSDKRDFRAMLEYLESKYRETFEEFCSKYVIPIVSKAQFDSLKDILRDNFESSKTYREFLEKLAEDHDCLVFYKWLSYFMSKITNFPFHDAYWKIPKKNAGNLEINRIQQKPRFDFVIFGGGDFDAEPWQN